MADLDDRGTGEAPKLPRSDYIPKVAIVPQTLDDLMKRAGPFAHAVETHLEWSAVSLWLMKTDGEQLAAASLPVRVANLSVILTREAEEYAAGWPRLTGPRVTPAIYGYCPDSQYEARRCAAEARSIWEANGRPYLRANDCKFAFQYLAACIRNGIIPPIPTMGNVEPSSPPKPTPPHILNMFKENQ